MARRRYYRVRRIVPKQKWLPVNNEVNVRTTMGIEAGYYGLFVEPLITNPTKTDSDGSSLITSVFVTKCGRFKLKGVIQSPNSFNYLIGISYVPEGYSLATTDTSYTNIGESFFYKHPEWVMCWTRIDYNNNSQRNEFSLTSKLKRNLNSGDRIVLFVFAINNSAETQTGFYIHGTTSYVCRSN